MASLLLAVNAFADEGKAINWISYSDIQKESDPIPKKVFLYFSSRSCGYCRMLEKKTFTDKAVIDYLNTNYRPVWISTDKELRLAKQFSVSGVPDLRFLTHEGKAIARWPGYIEAKDLLNLLKFVHTDSYQKMSYREFIKQQG